MAGNQLGKTLCAGAEVAMHLTGRYPDWWDGYEYKHATPWWVSGVTSEATRDNPQRILMGRNGNWGTGMIPHDALIGDPAMRRGVVGAIDSVRVRYGGGGDIQGGESSVGFKSYDQGREKWQGETLGGVWDDEEPPEDIYTEGMTRTNVGLGRVMVTFTPLQGMSNVVRRFYPAATAVPGTHVTQMVIDDAEHFTDEERAAIIASYPEYERAARTRGIPLLGSGRVFPLDEALITCAPFEVPAHWPQICGIDFGWDHPSAAVRLAWDRDNDIIYVVAAYRKREQTPLMFCAAVKPWGQYPWAWPHDGKQSGGKFDARDQQQLQAIYKGHGLKMLDDHATFENGSNGVEAGVQEMLDRMQTGRWKVLAHLEEWLEEFRMYHRLGGLIVKEVDDLISASRYAYMMRRHGKVRQSVKRVPLPAGSWMSS